MFGCCVAGRLLQTNVTQVDDTHAYFELNNAASINHVCVFLLGDVPFPEGYGCAVHFYWPGKGFQLLGMLSNDKPSAIFRLRGNFSSSGSTAAQDRFSSFSQSDQTMSTGEEVTAILGLSVEDLPSLYSQVSALQGAVVPSQPGQPDLRDPVQLAERIVKHLINYLSGFTVPHAGPNGGGGIPPDASVPMSLIARWYESFVGKVRVGGLGFLERVE